MLTNAQIIIILYEGEMAKCLHGVGNDLLYENGVYKMVKKFRLTKKRIDAGILSPALLEKYNDLLRAKNVVNDIKNVYPDQYVDVVKDRLEKTTISVTTVS